MLENAQTPKAGASFAEDIQWSIQQGKHFKKRAIANLAEYIQEKENIKTIIESEPRAVMYHYDGGVYNPNAEGIIRQEARKIGEEMLSTSDINEVTTYIKTISYVSETDFDTDLEYVCVKNGLLNIKTLELKEHDPEYLTRVQLPIEYDKDAKCERWLKFLEEVIIDEGKDKTDEHAAKIMTLQEIAGYCLLKTQKYEKAIMLTGEGRNGKSVFLDLIKEMLGRENVSSAPLQAFDTRQYATSSMLGKLANIHADLSDKALKYSGNFKQIVSGDSIYIEEKYKNAISAIIYAKQIFSANTVPETSDTTPAFFRRWIIINFPNKFEGENADKELRNKLVEELPGILNWALEGLGRLIKQDHFSYEPTVEEMEIMYITLSSPVAAFINDCLKKSSEGVISKTEMYSVFVKYAKSRKMPLLTDNAFARKLKENGVMDSKRGKIASWVGLDFKSTIDVIEDISFTVSNNKEYNKSSKNNLDNADIPNEPELEVEESYVKDD